MPDSQFRRGVTVPRARLAHPDGHKSTKAKCDPPQGAGQAAQGLKSFKGKEICSGGGGGAGSQSRASSTIWRIRRNHHCGLRTDGRRVTRDDRRAFRALKLSSNCALFIISV